MGSSRLSAAKAALKASTRMRSLVACAVRYLRVARRRRLRSSRDNPAQGEPGPLERYASSDNVHGSKVRSLKKTWVRYCKCNI